MRKVVRLLMAGLVLAGVFGAAQSCKVVEAAAEKKVDESAGTAVLERVEEKSPELAQTLKTEAAARAAAGEAWPWTKTISAHWLEIAGVLAVAGGAGLKIAQALKRGSIASAAAEAMSLAIQQFTNGKSPTLSAALETAQRASPVLSSAKSLRGAMEDAGLTAAR